MLIALLSFLFQVSSRREDSCFERTCRTMPLPVPRRYTPAFVPFVPDEPVRCANNDPWRRAAATNAIVAEPSGAHYARQKTIGSALVFLCDAPPRE